MEELALTYLWSHRTKIVVVSLMVSGEKASYSNTNQKNELNDRTCRIEEVARGFEATERLAECLFEKATEIMDDLKICKEAALTQPELMVCAQHGGRSGGRCRNTD